MSAKSRDRFPSNGNQSGHLLEYRDIWQRKPVLRALYGDYHRRMAAACGPGRTLEIGGGAGHLKALRADVLSSDFQPAPWLDLVADAQALPLADASLDNIVMLDVLHHIERPRRFFEEARRTLRPGGRIVLLEPAMTPLSILVYRFAHPEPVDLAADPLADAAPTPGRDPYDANQAIPTLLFRRAPERFARLFPDLALRRAALLSLFAFPLSGGFRAWSLIPAALVRPLLALETALAPLLGPLMAFRLLVVIERR